MKKIAYTLSIALAFNASQAMEKDYDKYNGRSYYSSSRGHTYQHDDDNYRRREVKHKDSPAKHSNRNAPYTRKIDNKTRHRHDDRTTGNDNRSYRYEDRSTRDYKARHRHDDRTTGNDNDSSRYKDRYKHYDHPPHRHENSALHSWKTSYPSIDRTLHPTVTFQNLCDGNPISEQECAANNQLRAWFDGRTSIDDVGKKIISQGDLRLIYNCAKALRHVDQMTGGDESKQVRSSTGSHILYDQKLLQLSKYLLKYGQRQTELQNINYLTDLYWSDQLKQTRDHLTFVNKNLAHHSVAVEKAQKAKEAKRIDKDRADIELMQNYIAGRAEIDEKKLILLRRTAKCDIRPYEEEESNDALRLEREQLDATFKKLFSQVAIAYNLAQARSN